jgi:hypothetical protein
MLGGPERALKKPVCPQKSGQNIVPALHSNMDVPVAHNGMAYMPIELAFDGLLSNLVQMADARQQQYQPGRPAPMRRLPPVPTRHGQSPKTGAATGVRVTPAELTGG